ncbi:Na+/H+ antiporter [Listeria kieliensis]|uniref:Sodium:proton antiporter n=1 Tax=Listeria kieliensis TaxID=1621700 RepID=A0A3D8TSS3_9LIST|nr:Na+/H+ antiporter [Listeria kieliensis]RDX02116.1 sodium:proton antiporter [Listeria kieliensis]
MEIFLFVLLLLLAILVSNLLNRFVPVVSVPLIQIGLGILIALLPLGFELELNPELFLLLFIAPLLFNDGKRTDKKALWKLRVPILLLALGLVFITVLVIGYFVNWMIPTIPLAAAFALAAALAPTDAVAVSSLSGRITLPKRVMSLLEGESLINDASGLVSFQFAIAAMVTGTFSLLNASWSFLVIAIGGALVGLILTLLKFQLLKWVRGLGMEDVTFHMLIEILTPFVIYLAAEELHVSGILAVVAAGIMHAVERKRLDPQLVKLSVVSKSTWSVIIFVLNGLVFLILGTQLPSIARVVWEDSGISNTQVLIYTFFITLALILLRFFWVSGLWMFDWLFKSDKSKKQRPSIRASVLTSLSGVRGAVTLATALSIPFFLDNGDMFPQRALIIFMASGVILFTLLIATFILPILARGNEADLGNERAERATQIWILRNVKRELQNQITPDNKAATEMVIRNYRRRIQELQQGENSQKRDMTQAEKAKRLEIISWEHEHTQELLADGKISAETAYRYGSFLNMMESALKQKFKARIRNLVVFGRRLLRILIHPKRLRAMKSKMREQHPERAKAFKEIRFVRIENEKMVIRKLKAQMNQDNMDLLLPLLNEHKEQLERLTTERVRPSSREKFEQKVHEVELSGIQIERDTIQSLFEEGKISRDLARDMRQDLNLLETYTIEEDLV